MTADKRQASTFRSIFLKAVVSLACTGWIAGAASATAEAEASMPQQDRLALGEAFRLSDQLGDTIWPGWTTAPFAVLVVTPEYEYLVRHPKPSPDFVHLGYDAQLKSEIYRRPRQFQTDMEATFPAVSDVPTIIIGEPGKTHSKNATAWVVTLMHEHFHQLQSSRPGYFEGVLGLGLAKGENSGMWMLNFPFRYTDIAIGNSVTRLCAALLAPATTAEQYDRLREEFRAAATPDEAKYAGFQFWQEGIARYTEMRVADWAAAHYTPSPDFAARDDYRPFSEQARALHERVEGQLAQAKLAVEKRGLFYAIGAGEGMLLDRTRPAWKSRYFARPFDTAPYFRN